MGTWESLRRRAQLRAQRTAYLNDIVEILNGTPPASWRENPWVAQHFETDEERDRWYALLQSHLRQALMDFGRLGRPSSGSCRTLHFLMYGVRLSVTPKATVQQTASTPLLPPALIAPDGGFSTGTVDGGRKPLPADLVQVAFYIVMHLRLAEGGGLADIPEVSICPYCCKAFVVEHRGKRYCPRHDKYKHRRRVDLHGPCCEGRFTD